MEARMHGGEIALFCVNVELRCVEPGVAEQLAHFLERGAALEKVRGERVTETMRREVHADRARRAGDDAPERARREREERTAGARTREVRAKRGDGRRADRHHARLAAFAASNGHDAILEVDVVRR